MPSSSSCASRTDERLAVIACGALAGHVRDLARRNTWPIEVHPLAAGLHNRPDRIAPAVDELARSLFRRGLHVALGYADCGSYGAVDQLCENLGIQRLRGLHCYDVFGGANRVRALLERDPGTYLLTDYLVRSFDRTVLTPLGLNKHPELWTDYFGHYRRLVWLAQERSAELDASATWIATRFGLPLLTVDVGTSGLERELARLLHSSGALART